MKTLMLFCILAGAMSAQTLIGLPSLKLGLEGTFDAPILANNSGRVIIGYRLCVEDETPVHTNIPVYRLAGISSGTKDTYVRVDGLDEARAAGRQAMARAVHYDGTPVIVSRISLDGVIFADGEFAGPDVSQGYRFAAAHVNAMREFAFQALADMTSIEAAVRTWQNTAPQNRFFRKGHEAEQLIATQAEDDLAAALYSIQQTSGIEAARLEAYRLSQLPKLWKGTQYETTK